MSISLKKHNENLHSFSELIMDEKQCATTIDPGADWIQKVLDEQKRKTEEAFKVLIVGAFNSGKSSMINAMAGKDFLPTGDLPETGVVTELIYGERFRITLYPREGSGITEPVVLDNPSVDAIKQYCSIDNKAYMNNEKVTTENMCYERTVVECDIPLLKEGIMLIDTVGMNDPWGNDYITERYFPKADAVIYLMNCGHFYDENDKILLTRINEYGFRDLIVVGTHFSELLYRNRRKPQSVIDDFCEVARRHAANHTDIGDEGIHFIDSLDGLEAKQSGDEEALVRSGLTDFEKFCARYLVENKGRIKVRTLNSSMQMMSKELISLADKVKVGATADKNELVERISKADREIAVLEEKAQADILRFKRSVADARPLLEASITTHVSQLANEVNLDDYALQESLPHGGVRLIPGSETKKADAIRKECQEELTRRMQAANKLWVSTKLTPQLESVIRDSIEDIGSELTDFYNALDSIDATLSGLNAKERTKRSITDVVAGVAYSVIMLDPYTGALAVTHGAGTMGKALAGQAAAGIALGLLGVPITLPLLAAAGIITNLLAILVGDVDKKEAKIKRDVVIQYRQIYSEAVGNHQQTVDGLVRACERIIASAGTQLEKLLNQELEKKRREILAIRDTAERDVVEKNKIVERNDQALQELETIRVKGNTIVAQYN